MSESIVQQNNNTSQYGENSKALTAAFAGFKAYYREMVQPPAMPVLTNDKIWVYRGLLLIVVCSTILGATHSLPLFADTVHSDIRELEVFLQLTVAITAFASVSSAVFVAGFLYTKHRFQYEKESTHPRQIGLFLIGMQILAFSIEIVANTYGVFDGLDVISGQVKGGFLFVTASLIGVSAPLQALFSGHVLGLLVVIDLHAKNKALLDYENARKAYEDEMLSAWEIAKKQSLWRVQNANVQPVQSVQLNSSELNTRGTERSEMNYMVGASERVKAYLNENETAWKLPVRKLAETLNVSVGTVSKVKNEMLQEVDNHE